MNEYEWSLHSSARLCVGWKSAEYVDLCRSSVTKSLVGSLNGNDEAR